MGGETLVERVRAMLSGVRGVEEKRMFGGHAFMVRGKMCVTARPQRIMCRIDPAIHDDAVKRKGCRTMVMKGRPYRGYVHVDAEAVETDAALKTWVDLALAYNKVVASARRT